jgi:hypothetical protein
VKQRSLAIAALLTSILLADGSTVIFRKAVDPFDVTLFGNESRLTLGQNNVSVMVQNSSDHTDVADAHVTLRFTRQEQGKIVELVAPATHAKAANKMLYGANINIPGEGYWTLTIEVEANGARANVPVQIPVAAAEPQLSQKWPLILFIPVAIVLFVINRRLKRRWIRPNPQARP